MARIFDSDGLCDGADSFQRGIRQNNEDGGRQHSEVPNYAALLAHREIPQHPQSSNWNGQSATISTSGPQQPQPLRMYETWNNVDPKLNIRGLFKSRVHFSIFHTANRFGPVFL
jgi:hypothetical protein